MPARIYLDYNATAPAKPDVVTAVAETLAEGGNASSVHGSGRAARGRVEKSRREVAALAGTASDRVVFTGSGTEANNQVLRGAGRARVLTSAIEHESVLLARPDAERIAVTAEGVVDLSALERALAERGREPALVSLMLANNETGIVQKVAEAARLAHANGALIHCDAVQAMGKIAVDVDALGVDFLTMSAHKLAGPQGVGALVVRDPGGVARLIHGGGQERGLRAGTENVPGIAGFGVAAALALRDLGDFAALAALRDRLEAALGEIDPDAVAFGRFGPRLPNTSKIVMPGVGAETQIMAMDLAGIAVSAGSACSAGKIEPPYVLSAMGVADEVALSAIRVSLGWATEPSHIERFVEVWRDIRSRASAAARTPLTASIS